MLNTPFSPWPSFTQEEADAVSRVLLSNKVNYWTGNECRQFEKEFAAFADCEYAVALSNGTLALDVALKALEGTARFVTDLLKRSFLSSIRSKIGFLISRPATEMLRDQLDPNNHNGAVFLGLNGVVVKSHGSADAKGVANAVEVAARLVEDSILERISEDLTKIGEAAPVTEVAK